MKVSIYIFCIFLFISKYIREEKTKSFYNIERKYFKTEKLPNMLTYIEKHQIKHLNKEDPEFWNINKLAESFPATPDIIKVRKNNL